MRRVRGGLAIAALAVGVAVTGSTLGRDNEASGATRAPIPITTIVDLSGPAVGSSFKTSVNGATAAVQAVNAAGGINGRPLKLTVCDSKTDPNAGAQCARDAAKSNAAAVVGQLQLGGATATLQREGIASVGSVPLNPEDFKAKTAFPFSAGNIGTRGLAGILVNQAKAKRIGVAITAIPGADLAANLIKTYMQTRGLSVANVTSVPPGAADLTPLVAAAARGADAIAVVLSPADTLRFVQTARQNGVKLPMSAYAMAAQEVQKIGSAAEGLYEAFPIRPLSAGGTGVKQFTAEMKKYQPKANRDFFAVNGWLAVHMFADVAKKLKTVNKASVLKAMSSSRNLDGYGFIPAMSPAVPFKGLGGNFPRLFNRSAFYVQWRSGKEKLLTPTAQLVINGG